MNDTPTSTYKPSVAERVDLGIAWLDENHPGWADLISLADLQMFHTCNCVLGQAFHEAAGMFAEDSGRSPFDFSGFDFALELAGEYDDDKLLDDPWAVRYGFDDTSGNFEALQREWYGRIFDRQNGV